MLSFTNYITEDTDSAAEITFEDFETILEDIATGIVNEKYYVDDKILKVYNTLKTELSTLAKRTGYSIKVLARALKQRDVYALLKAVRFNVTRLVQLIGRAFDLMHEGLIEVFEDMEKTGAFKALQKGTSSIDEYLDQYPILKKLNGPIIAGLLVYIWLNMTFIGNFKYDMDLSAAVNAMKGNYTIKELFVSKEGALLMTLFATGGLVSFPWLGITGANLLLALAYTGYVNGKERLPELKNIKNNIKTRPIRVRHYNPML